MITDIDMLIRLLIAAVLGGVVGFERERHGRTAGLRTHILVSLGSALIMLTSIHMFDIYKGTAQVDPARIAAQVVTGIGFLGAGAIMRFRASVRGLTTAASLWVIAAIGLAVGAGMLNVAIGSTLLVIVVLFVFSKLERVILRKDWYKTIVIDTRGGAEELKNIREVLAKYSAEIRDFEVEKEKGTSLVSLRIDLKLLTNREDDKIIFDITKINGVEKASWEE